MKITIKFNGGFRDGSTLEGDTEIPRSAAAYPFLTENGTVGRRVTEMPTESWREIFRLFSPDEKSAAFKKAAEEFTAKHKSNQMTDGDMEAAIENLVFDVESDFPRSPDVYSRLSEFKHVIYEIVSQEIIDDCICVCAEYIGEDPDNVFPEWPPRLDAG